MHSLIENTFCCKNKLRNFNAVSGKFCLVKVSLKSVKYLSTLIKKMINLKFPHQGLASQTAEFSQDDEV